MLWTASLTLVATPLLGVAYPFAGFVLLLLPFTLILSIIDSRWLTAGRLVILFMLAGVFTVTWLIVFRDNYQSALFLPTSLALFVMLYWVRWWALHAPRTWLDQINKELA